MVAVARIARSSTATRITIIKATIRIALTRIAARSSTTIRVIIIKFIARIALTLEINFEIEARIYIAFG